MNNVINNPKVIAITLTALLFASVLWLMNEKRINSSLEDGLTSEKLKAESLLAEKLLLEKDIAKFKDQMSSLTGKNQELDKILNQTAQKLNAKEAEFNRVNKENASLQKIKKQQNELLAIRKDLDSQIENLKSSLQSLQVENSTLNNKVAFLEQRNKLLNDELHNAMLASLDHAQVDAMKKSEQLTIKASRTKKLIANFEVPAELTNLSFKVISPSGNPLTANEGTIASRVLSTSSNLSASAETTVSDVSRKTKKVEMVYIPTKKLVAGTYKIEILNDNLYVGSLQVKFR